MSTAVYYMIGAEDGGLWPWPKRMPTSLPDSTSAGKFDAFFGKMAIQHEATMKDEPHVCMYNPMRWPAACVVHVSWRLSFPPVPPTDI